MTILALETTDKVASVALLTDSGLLEKRIESPLRHEETVMPAVDELLAEAGLTPADLTALAVDVGPGSFTGVRIGVCHGNAMAMALDLPIVPVNALEALAYPLLGGSAPVAAVIDARNGNGNAYARWGSFMPFDAAAQRDGSTGRRLRIRFQTIV